MIDMSMTMNFDVIRDSGVTQPPPLRTSRVDLCF